MGVLARAEARLDEEEKALARRYATELARETREQMSKRASPLAPPVATGSEHEDGADDDE
jgi:hypothetical protein